ncbi:[protein-PII] uridylyltransferase [Thalassomonas haliotis]|uniref:Bifunctional uridylyltransferase/uridylyl-removing enzyme n=1 Tax=Thalassomonas haliotis TaxID=485448 RepID=A0ABY7VJ98_9GAMM|nr:[protein-PII] uridylyltransferase [Thalassomonas haliotis]WDE13832.1 [protein-PII] uridylyltransferase [Thalassomonas haliotis]
MPGIKSPLDIDLTKPAAIKAYLLQHEARLSRQFFETSIESLQTQRAVLFDNLLMALWRYYGLQQANNISLNAVGGFGRQTLHPRSDIDICIIFDKGLEKEQEANLSAFLTRLWDLGVDVGHAVRSEKDNIEAAKADITIATNLLDIRTLCGPANHAKNILEKLYTCDIWSSRLFFQHKVAEQDVRHEKANNTALYLEPNIKNNPGGMRDVQTIIWIARKHFNVGDAQSLKSLGFLKFDEYSELIESYDFICRIRWALHTVANRAEEKLLFDHQLDVAKFMKFGHGENAQLAVEKMMRQLFRAMTRVQELNQMMLGVFKREVLYTDKKACVRVDLDEHFFVSNNMIQAKYDEVFFNKSNVIRLFGFIAGDDDIHGIAPETLRLIRQTRRQLLGELQDYQECRKAFIALIKHENGLKRAFALMHRYGILASYFPQWKAIEGQMQFDMHNAYTVDEHAFKLIQCIDNFTADKKQKSLLTSIYRASSLKHILVIAGLCHDLSGKQSHETNEISAIHAKEFALLHDLKKSEVDLIHWIVDNQDLLIATTQTLDIQDPEVIKTVAKKIRSEAKLNALYCFTVADLMATNEQSWNEWQQSLLNELYLSLRSALKKGIENVFEQRVVIRENKIEALAELTANAFDEAEIKALWASLPSSFFSSNQVNEIAEFSAQILAHRGDDQVVSLSDDTNLECSNLLVYANDRSMLFVDLFNALSLLKIRVKEAQLHKTKNNKVLEVIKLLDHNGETIADGYRSEQVKKSVRKVLCGPDSVKKPASPRFVKNFENAPEVEFLATPKSNKTLLRINALDNPLFIEKICNVFKHKQLTIHSAKISTLGECSENVFTISSKDNSAISNQDKTELAQLLVNNIA